MKKLRVLLVEDCEDDAILLTREVARGGYEPLVERVDSADALTKAISEGVWDVVISDYNLPQFNALAALEILKKSGLDLPFIIVSGKIGEDIAVAAMKAGAHDYLMKANLARLVPAIERELREAVSRETRRKVEAAIRQGKTEWQAVFDAVSDLIILTDHDGNIVRCNRRVVDYFQKSYQQVLGCRIEQLFYGEATDADIIFQKRSMASPENSEDPEGDVCFPTLDGWFNVASYPINSESKNQAVVHIIKDITRRKNMEEEKRVSERELLTLYAIAFRLNSNKGFTKILEDVLFQLHNMLKIDFSTIHLLEDDSLRLKASFGISLGYHDAVAHLANTSWTQQVLAGKPFCASNFNGEFPVAVTAAAKAMGMHGWCAVPLKVGSGVIGVLMVAHKGEKGFSDREVFLLNTIGNQIAVLIENHILYTKMKEKAAELERSRQELKDNLVAIQKANVELGRLNAAKTTFIGMASHELKTPLTSILGGLQFLYKYGNLPLSDEQSSIFTSVYEGVVDLKKLVEDLLSISRIEAEGVVIDRKPLRVMRLCQEVYESLQLAISKRNINVEIKDDGILIPADDGLFRLVIRNLLENAIKFTPDGGTISLAGWSVPVEDVLACTELVSFYDNLVGIVTGSSYYRLDVTDTGIGIPIHERVRIFDKFYGVGDIAYHSSGKTDFMSKGSGLGLSIVKGIIEAHGGLVWNAAGPNDAGTVFSILIPVDTM